ncbi:MAG: aldehyde dehydrogenase family protein [Gammaproteobacteria bacterium]|nr:aldehyde dehydrogenase family protein [Gammaproteobacteria bacterium]
MQRFSDIGRATTEGVTYWPLMVGGMTKPFGLLDVTMPFDGRLLARIETSGLEHVERGLDIAYGLFRDRRSWLPLDERIGVLERCVRIMARMQDTLAVTTSREAGKPLRDSRVEVQHAIDEARLCVVHLRSDAGHVLPTGATHETVHRFALTRYEPAGVVVAVSTYSHPLNVVAQRIFAAVAAGCPVVVKPAEEAPLSSLQIVAILRRAGLPAPWCQVVVAADAETAERLVADVRVGTLSYVGDATAGWRLRSSLNPKTRWAATYGGAAPVFVMEEACAASAVDGIIRGAYYHAGQVSVSMHRIFVPDTFARQFAAVLAARAEVLAVGDPVAVTTEVGPLMRPSETSRVGARVNEAVTCGAELLTGGSAIGESLYRPTVLFNPLGDTRLSRVEIPGPVIEVYAYDTLDAAITTANDETSAVQAAVFTSDLNAALRVFRQLDASAVTVNDQVMRDPGGMPFAGVGLGIGGDVRHAINTMRQSKMLAMNSQEL